MTKKKLKKKDEKSNGVPNENLKKRIEKIHKTSSDWYEENVGELDVEAGDVFDEMLSILKEVRYQHIDKFYEESISYYEENKKVHKENKIYTKINGDLRKTNKDISDKNIELVKENKDVIKTRVKILKENEKLGVQTKTYLNIIDYALEELPEFARKKVLEELKRKPRIENTYTKQYIEYSESTASQYVSNTATSGTTNIWIKTNYDE